MITSSSGVYSLVIFLRKKTTLTIGALGHQTFHPGIYIYTGSALGPGGLKARLKHHNENYKSQSRRNFWHIDFLLAHEHATLMGVIAARTSRNMECEMNRLIKQMEGVRSPVLGFGASDCKNNCGSHLLFFPDIIKDILAWRLVEVYKCASRGIARGKSALHGAQNHGGPCSNFRTPCSNA